MLKPPYITLITLWIIYGIIHSGLASGIATKAATKIMGRGAKYYRAIYSLFVLISLIILTHYHFAAVDTILFRPHWIEKIIAGLLIISGFVVIVICLWKYLLPLSGIGVVFGIETELPLQETGLHAYMRHPMFSGAVVFMWGVFFGYPYLNNLVSAICLTIYAFIAIFFEERKLVAVFGDRYRSYQKNVPVLLPSKFSGE